MALMALMHRIPSNPSFQQILSLQQMLSLQQIYWYLLAPLLLLLNTVDDMNNKPVPTRTCWSCFRSCVSPSASCMSRRNCPTVLMQTLPVGSIASTPHRRI